MHTTESKQKTIQQWKGSGLTQNVFCKQININIHTLHYWMRQLKDEAKPKDKFIKITQDAAVDFGQP
jgi:transposase-like protein